VLTPVAQQPVEAVLALNMRDRDVGIPRAPGAAQTDAELVGVRSFQVVVQQEYLGRWIFESRARHQRVQAFRCEIGGIPGNAIRSLTRIGRIAFEEERNPAEGTVRDL